MGWKEWGAYATCCAEGGIEYPSDQIIWDTVETDYMAPSTNYLYGGGLGIIQITSENYDLLRMAVENGYNMDNFPNGSVKNDLINGVKTIEWFKHSRNGGLFTLDEMYAVKDILNSEEGKQAQCFYMVKYFEENNKIYMDMIESSGLDNKLKAYLVNIIVLSPATVRTLLSPPVATTLDQMVSDSNSCLVGYDNRFQHVKNIVNQITDFNSEPPVNIWNLKKGSGNGVNQNPTIPEIPGDDTPIYTNPLPKKDYIEVKDGLLLQTDKYLYQLDSFFKIEKLNNCFRIRISNTGEENTTENNSNKVEDTSQKPIESIPNDKDNIINSFIDELYSIPFNTLVYQNIRPQGDLQHVNYADCSGYIAWGFRLIHPVVWNNGYVNTGTIYNIFKNNGFLTWEGSFNDLFNQKPVRGDIILFSDDNSFGNGNLKHVMCYVGDDKCVDMSGMGNQEQSYLNLIEYYRNNLGYFNFSCIIKIVK